MLLSEEAIDAILTDREMEILELVAAGLSAKEIAQRVAIAPRTVERHIENTRLKMRARNRPHLVMRAIASGMIGAGYAADQPMLFVTG
jgi:LuxR family transcriptional regulator, transcriptional regulator of spore coat protein